MPIGSVVTKLNLASASLGRVWRRIRRGEPVVEAPLGTTIRQIVGDDGVDLELPPREVGSPIDFSSDAYGTDTQ